ncbi:dipeptidyl aminopeptidase [Gordonia sp. TBRC 11910]|uniref:Dipeptidyl aminopeptidase n=2 Tax=Gordonia asplenii TaxID=2725283 RepID=A0A848KZ40_9ACTN|nr:dipeptidyl aminopeptidase [Gordonia asplenii]
MTRDGTARATREEIAHANQAHWRAMSTTRLLDCGMAYADVGELQRQTDGGTAWDRACEAIGVARRNAGDAAAAAGNSITAAHQFGWAAAGFLFAQMANNFDTDRKRELYDRFTEAVQRLATVSSNPLTRVEVPVGDGRLVGWHMRPAGREPIGTVILFGGQSGWGATYLRNAEALAQRGIATLLAEGPGQGESRMRYGIHLDVDVADAFGRFVTAALDDVDAPVGIWGNSVGGLFAALTAAADARLAACCVNGGFAAPRLLSFRTFAEQAAAMLGTTDEAAIEANFKRLRFDPSTHSIDVPLLVIHGGADPLVALADQQPFLEAAADATLQQWDDGDHTVYNHGDERNDLVADWFAEVFTRTR